MEKLARERWIEKEVTKNTAMEYIINCMFKSHGSISFLEAIKMCRLRQRINFCETITNKKRKTL